MDDGKIRPTGLPMAQPIVEAFSRKRRRCMRVPTRRLVDHEQMVVLEQDQLGPPGCLSRVHQLMSGAASLSWCSPEKERTIDSLLKTSFCRNAAGVRPSPGAARWSGATAFGKSTPPSVRTLLRPG